VEALLINRPKRISWAFFMLTFQSFISGSLTLPKSMCDYHRVRLLLANLPTVTIVGEFAEKWLLFVSLALAEVFLNC
jgi:hypothetical protein